MLFEADEIYQGTSLINLGTGPCVDMPLTRISWWILKIGDEAKGFLKFTKILLVRSVSYLENEI